MQSSDGDDGRQELEPPTDTNGRREEKDEAVEQATSSSTPPKKSAGWKQRLPTWIAAHLNARDLKILFRCVAAVWIAFVFLFIDPVLHAIGQAAFFTIIALLIVPPSGPVLMNLMGGATLLIGMALAWAWGTITMKAALAARPAAETQAQMQALLQTAERKANQTGLPVAEVAQLEVYNGGMLDTRITVVYFVMILTFIYFMARLRIWNPKLTLTSLFAIIISDIYLTIAPLVPSFDGTIPVMLIKPAAIGVGLNFVCAICIFPESTAYQSLLVMTDLLAPIRGVLQDTEDRLRAHRIPEPEEPRATKAKIAGASAALEPLLKFLPLDVSFGRWNNEDVIALNPLLRDVVMRTLMLLDMNILWLVARQKHNFFLKAKQQGQSEDALDTSDEITEEKKANGEEEKHGKEDSKKKGKHTMPDHAGELNMGKHQIAATLDLMLVDREETSAFLHDATAQSLLESSEDLLQCGINGLNCIEEAFMTVNRRRWFTRPAAPERADILARHKQTLDALHKARLDFDTTAREKTLAPYMHLFDAHGDLHLGEQNRLDRAQTRGLLLAMNYEEHISGVTRAVEKLLQYIVLLEEERTRSRLWPPAGLRHAGAWLAHREPTHVITIPDSDLGAQAQDPISEVEKGQKGKSGAAGSRPPRRKGLAAGILAFYEWFNNDEGVYALRVVAASLIALPAACTSSAGFFYREKGLWAVIMAQFALVPYLADFIFSLVCRTFGTVLGGVIGMVAWYIGSGNGPGNPYGLSAIVAVVLVFLVFGRLYAPPMFLQAVIISGATFALVVGYSYLDSHTPIYGNPGVGYSVFWRRLVLVLVGFGAALIVQIFPQPSSATVHATKVLSGILTQMGAAYYDTVSTCLAPPDSDSDDTDQADRLLPAALPPSHPTVSLLELQQQFAPLAATVAVSRFEISSSPFSSAALLAVARTIDLALGHLSQLSRALHDLPPALKTRYTAHTAAADPDLVGDVMAVVTILAAALRDNGPLPTVLPVPLVRRLLGRSAGRGDRWQALGMDLVRQEGFAGYSVVLTSYVSFLSRIDDLVLIVKQSVGEI